MLLYIYTKKQILARKRLIHYQKKVSSEKIILGIDPGKNVQSMLKLGRAQGVAMAAGLSRQVTITEYSPKKIKMAITGNGNASKEQVAKMLQSLLKMKQLPKNLDATDGLAAAVCHFYNAGKPQADKSYSGWASFVRNNEKRLG